MGMHHKNVSRDMKIKLADFGCTYIYSVSTCIQGLVGHKAGIYSVPYI